MAGDIVVAYETKLRESKEKGIPFRAHLAHLLTHGTLHLQGYDHMTDDDRLKMEAEQRRIMGSLGISREKK